MAVPFNKLPELLRTPLILDKITKIIVSHPPSTWYNNNPRYFYRKNAPLIKYYNPHL